MTTPLEIERVPTDPSEVGVRHEMLGGRRVSRDVAGLLYCWGTCWGAEHLEACYHKENRSSGPVHDFLASRDARVETGDHHPRNLEDGTTGVRTGPYSCAVLGPHGMEVHSPHHHLRDRPSVRGDCTRASGDSGRVDKAAMRSARAGGVGPACVRLPDDHPRKHLAHRGACRGCS